MTLSIEHYRKLLASIHDEASAALALAEPEQLTKALDNIRAMARYENDVVAVEDRVRSDPPTNG